MDLEFKIKLLALYPFYDKINGPYSRKDGRKHIVLNNSTLPNKHVGKLKTLSWPKALLEVKLGRLLLDNETADHIDENLANDDVDNLQPLARIDNIIKSFELNPNRYAKFSKAICPQCTKEFLVLTRQYRGNQLKQSKAGPFCSKQCTGKYGKHIQNARLVERQTRGA